MEGIPTSTDIWKWSVNEVLSKGIVNDFNLKGVIKMTAGVCHSHGDRKKFLVRNIHEMKIDLYVKKQESSNLTCLKSV